MLTWLSNNYLIIIALVVLGICLIALALLPSRKNMMMGRVKHVSRGRIKMAYGAALAAFALAGILALFFLLKPELFEKIMGSVFLYTNMILGVGIGAVLVVDARWVNNFSHEIEQESVVSTISEGPESYQPAEPGAPASVAKVQVVESPTFHIECPMCHQTIIVPHEMKGQVIQCPNCGVEGRIGGGSAQ